MVMHYGLQLEYTQENTDEKRLCVFLDVNP